MRIGYIFKKDSYYEKHDTHRNVVVFSPSLPSFWCELFCRDWLWHIYVDVFEAQQLVHDGAVAAVVLKPQRHSLGGKHLGIPYRLVVSLVLLNSVVSCGGWLF